MRKILLSIALLFIGGPVWAANYDNPIDGIFEGVYGNTFTIRVPSVVSKSPTSGDQTGDLSFQFRSDTNYQNFHQLSDLNKGDMVRVDYYPDVNKTDVLMARSISKINAHDMANADTTTPVAEPAENTAAYGSTTDSSTAPSQTTVTTITTTTNPQ